jgi:hypothetical protein
MSEFSESYHLRDASQSDAAQLLRRVGLKGIVFPTTDRWTSFVPIGEDWEGLEAIAEVNEGYLLHYSYGADHGWVIDVYKGSEQRLHFEYSWDDELDEDFGEIDTTRPSNVLDLELLTQWLVNAENVSELQACFEVSAEETEDVGDEEELEDKETEDEEELGNVAYCFAKLIGLEHFRWMSPSYLSHEPDYYDDLEIIKVL